MLLNMLAFNMPGGWELLLLLALGLLLFGKRLPEVGRSLGRSIVEFKRGVQGIQEEIETESRKTPSPDNAPAAGTEPANASLPESGETGTQAEPSAPGAESRPSVG